MDGSCDPAVKESFRPASEDQKRIWEYAEIFFPELAAGTSSYSSLPVLDKATSEPYYNRKIRESEGFDSTGTTGWPKTIYWTKDEDDWYQNEKKVLFQSFLGNISRGYISLGRGHNADSAAALLRGMGYEILQLFLEPLDKQVSACNQFRPEFLYCSPSLLEKIIVSGEHSWPVKKIILNGEIFTRTFRNKIMSYFQIGPADIMDTYGSTEVGTIAYSCQDCGCYHFMPGVFPESLPAEPFINESIPGLSQMRVLLLSSVKRASFPVIRFVTYDLVEGLEVKTCRGKREYSFEKIIGRCDEVLNYGELLPARDLLGLLDQYYPDGRYLIYNHNNLIDIAVEGAEQDGFLTRFYECFPLHAELIQNNLIRPVIFHYRQNLESYFQEAEARTHKGPKRILKKAWPGYTE